jgi:hypothetical protein
MGKGSKTNQQNVVKQMVREGQGATGGSGGGAAGDDASANLCLFKLAGSIEVMNAKGASTQAGIAAAIAPNHNGELHIYAGSNDLGRYTNGDYELIRSCVASGYIYTGSITQVETRQDKTLVSYELAGRAAS